MSVTSDLSTPHHAQGDARRAFPPAAPGTDQAFRLQHEMTS